MEARVASSAPQTPVNVPPQPSNTACAALGETPLQHVKTPIAKTLGSSEFACFVTPRVST